MIDRMTWALAAAHPQMRPAWLQSRMLPMISPVTRPAIVAPKSASPKPFVRVATSAIPAPRKCESDDTPAAVYQPTIRAIVLETARAFDIEVIHLLSERRTWKVVIPRQAAMYIASKMTTRSLVQIGKKMGGRDHTTVIHAVARTEQRMAKDAMLGAKIEHIMRLLSEACGEESRAAA